MVRVRKTLIDPRAETMVRVGGESIHLAIQGCAQVRRQRRLVCNRGDHGQFVGKWCQPLGLDAILVEKTGIVVADLLGNAAPHGMGRVRPLNKVAYPLVGLLHQHRARIGGCRRSKPVPIGVPVEVVPWPDGTIDVRVLRARILINRCGHIGCCRLAIHQHYCGANCN